MMLFIFVFIAEGMLNMSFVHHVLTVFFLFYLDYIWINLYFYYCLNVWSVVYFLWIWWVKKRMSLWLSWNVAYRNTFVHSLSLNRNISVSQIQWMVYVLERVLFWIANVCLLLILPLLGLCLIEWMVNIVWKVLMKMMNV